MSLEEWIYLTARTGLAVGGLAVAWITLRYARSSIRATKHGYIGFAGSALLAASAFLSAYDGIDNVLLRPKDPILTISWVWFSIFDTALPIYAWLLVRSLRTRDRLLARLRELSITDPLTGALNRRGFLERAAVCIARGRQAGRPATLVLFDLDRFKTVNDACGHAAGDVLLKTFVATAAPTLGKCDLLGRLGGDEFVVLLAGSEIAIASVTVAHLLREAETAFESLQGGSGISVSAGMTSVDATDTTAIALTRALSKADEALYAAKMAGMGRIAVARAASRIELVAGSDPSQGASPF